MNNISCAIIQIVHAIASIAKSFVCNNKHFSKFVFKLRFDTHLKNMLFVKRCNSDNKICSCPFGTYVKLQFLSNA